jgi:hypothetical protein
VSLATGHILHDSCGMVGCITMKLRVTSAPLSSVAHAGLVVRQSQCTACLLALHTAGGVHCRLDVHPVCTLQGAGSKLSNGTHCHSGTGWWGAVQYHGNASGGHWQCHSSTSDQCGTCCLAPAPSVTHWIQRLCSRQRQVQVGAES